MTTYYLPPTLPRVDSAPSDLAERLGFTPDTRVLLINADDFGMSHSSNLGISSLLANGAIGSATLMTPCGWAPEAADFARTHPELNVGVHLVFTSEWDAYRWGPVSTEGSASSLIDGSGYFHEDVRTLEVMADEAQVRSEIFAQIDRAISLGVVPTHLDNHMGSLYGTATGRPLLSPVFDACEHFRLPFRLPRVPFLYDTPMSEPVLEALAALLGPLVAEADRRGIVILDHLWTLPFDVRRGESYETLRGDAMRLVDSLLPGVTEYYLHPFEMSDELRAISTHSDKRAWELKLMTDPVFTDHLAASGVELVTWRQLRDLQREGA